MAGIYIHIPFCTKACHYCDFHFSTSLKNKSILVDAILKEIMVKKSYLEEKTIETIYFGGGTPSLLSKKELLIILDTIHHNYQVKSNAEITLEANPDDLSKSKLLELKEAGINRLSIGIQSFYEEDLKWMNRSHNNEQSYQAVKTAQDLGYDNITIDLIYGSPGLSIEKWNYNLSEAIKLNVPHISSYNLTVESKTVLAHQVKKGITKMPKDETIINQFKLLIDTLEEHSFEHYEISNFAKEGYISKHNSSYWLGKHYLGIGPSAHSFNGVSRSWNIANNNQYIKLMNDNKKIDDTETIELNTAYNEYLLTRLRTKWGIELDDIAHQFGKEKLNTLRKTIQPFIENQEVKEVNNTYKITNKGKFIIDTITTELFEV